MATKRVLLRVFEDRGGVWRWQTLSPVNGKITATSGEAFASKSNAKRAASRFFDCNFLGDEAILVLAAATVDTGESTQ